MADYDQKSNTSLIQLDMHQNILEVAAITLLVIHNAYSITTTCFLLQITHQVEAQTINPYSKEMRTHDCKNVSLYLPPRLLFSALKSQGLGFSSSLSQDLWKLKKEIKIYHATNSHRLYENSYYLSKNIPPHESFSFIPSVQMPYILLRERPF